MPTIKEFEAFINELDFLVYFKPDFSSEIATKNSMSMLYKMLRLKKLAGEDLGEFEIKLERKVVEEPKEEEIINGIN
jgi:hypothetical protein